MLQSQPSWTHLSPGWKRLDAIKVWLDQQGAVSSSFWRLEGRLELAEGLLEQACSDLGTGPEPEREEALLARRVNGAEQDFRYVLRAPAANPEQTRRADRGLERSATFRARMAKRPLDGRGLTGAGHSRLAIDLIPRKSWRAFSPRRANLTPASGHWDRITLHHSAEATPPNLDGTLRASVAAVRSIQKAHVQGSGYGDIGYHYIIDPSGRIFEGRSLAWRGAHASGSNNSRNLGICLLGNFEHQKPAAAALGSLEELLSELRREYRIAAARVYEHKEFKNTLCPGKHLSRWLSGYESRLAMR